MSRYCPNCKASHPDIILFGSFVRKSDGKKIRRFRCLNCKKTFSQATFQDCYQQRKRRVNPRVKELLASCVSQRRIAKVLRISRVTVARKLVFLGEDSKKRTQKKSLSRPTVTEVQFDDLESFEHTKCKPLSVTMAVESHTRIILGFKVSVMPAKGHLAAISRKKYGPRPDERKKGRHLLFAELQQIVSPTATFTSDESPHYLETLRKFFPKAKHHRVKAKRGCVTGQGELKKTGFDPLFSLNHTFAMLRANINRLVRKTWCTTKSIERLNHHLAIYVDYHNTKLLSSSKN